MTKEGILIDAQRKIDPYIGFTYTDPAIFKAMDEYAKQFGEELIGWLNDNDFKPSSFKDNMQSDYVNNGERMHASDIVDLFIEQQNKDNEVVQKGRENING